MHWTKNDRKTDKTIDQTISVLESKIWILLWWNFKQQMPKASFNIGIFYTIFGPSSSAPFGIRQLCPGGSYRFQIGTLKRPSLYSYLWTGWFSLQLRVDWCEVCKPMEQSIHRSKSDILLQRQFYNLNWILKRYRPLFAVMIWNRYPAFYVILTTDGAFTVQDCRE